MLCFRVAWGCDKSTLLVLYRAYIRSCMEYGGCQAFDNAAPSVLQKLDVVQSSALRVCTGASNLPLYLSYADVDSPMLQHLRSLQTVIIPLLVSWNITLFRKLEPLNIGHRLVRLLGISVILW